MGKIESKQQTKPLHISECSGRIGARVPLLLLPHGFRRIASEILPSGVSSFFPKSLIFIRLVRGLVSSFSFSSFHLASFITPTMSSSSAAQQLVRRPVVSSRSASTCQQRRRRDRMCIHLANRDLFLFTSSLTMARYLLRRIIASSRRATLAADSASSSPPERDKGIR